MIENIMTLKLDVDEELAIRKNSLCAVTPENDKRIAIVTGIHGDELEGQYICYRLVKEITENMQYLKGKVDIYPAINPLGMESVSRAVPTSGLDMNKLFSAGEDLGSNSENIGKRVVEDIMGADLCVDLHASNMFIREIPQVRIAPKNSDILMKYARKLNTDLIWLHESGAVGDGSLAEALIEGGVPTLAVEMGVGGRIDRIYCDQLLRGIFNLMNYLGIWTEEEEHISNPVVAKDSAVHVVHSVGSGIFIPTAEHNMWLEKGSEIGEIVTPITGTRVQVITAPVNGVVFSLREYPIVYEGSVIARMLDLDNNKT
ncbi:MAG: succinylglutamate desuccinylase/aspartoacylase family protein [Oscillospiraceae bacterium]|nr:succinylglutamate desuccinylase/aspartoacylase family protein [Oscillospiraceae bacterium]